MSLITQTDELLAGPGEQIPALLRARGLLPAQQAGQPVDHRSIGPSPTSAVFVHVDPRRPHVDGKAGTYSWGPARLDTMANPAEIIVRHDDNDFPYLLLRFSGLGANTAALVALDIQVHGLPAHGVRLSATGNPISMIVTNGATGGVRVTVQVALTSGSNPALPAYVELRPTGLGQAFSWYGADLHRL